MGTGRRPPLRAGPRAELRARAPGLILLLWAFLSSSPGRAGGEPGLAWRPVPSEPGAASVALALDPRDGRLALGSERGARLLSTSATSVATGLAPEPAGFVRRGPVRALAFSERGLLVGTADGLYEGAGSRVTGQQLGAGAAGREVRDLDARHGVSAVATGAGLFLRLAGDDAWQRVPLPTGPVDLVVLLDAGGPEGGADALRAVLWTAGGPWSLAVRRPLRPRRLPRPRVSNDAPPVALARSEDGALLLLPHALAVLRRGKGQGEESEVWEVLRPSLPPGALLRDYARALGRHWLATDAGLLSAPRLAGPWSRPSGGPGGPALDVVGRGDALFVAGAREVRVAHWRQVGDRGVAGGGVGGGLAPLALPSIEAVQRATLRHQQLGRERAAALRRGVDARGWLPELSLFGSYERSRSRGGDYDESLTSGVRQLLHDRDYDRDREIEVGISLVWDLGDLAYHPESIDVSREARALIALRDDVLDEVNQLYFDRLRALSALAAFPGGAEQRDLEARVAELTAGLDAWTGGWFSQALRGVRGWNEVDP